MELPSVFEKATLIAISLPSYKISNNSGSSSASKEESKSVNSINIGGSGKDD
jgi:hypothetical protein